MKLQQDMRKKKQEMLKTQIECQKVRAFSPKSLHGFLLMISLWIYFIFIYLFQLLSLLGADKPTGEKPKHEAWGESQHNENPEGANGEDHPAAEWNEPGLPGLKC